MVNNIIKGRIDENQFVNSDLTFKDLEKIRESFLKVLSGIYHERIEYPKEKLNLAKENKEKAIEDKEVASSSEEQLGLKEPEPVIQMKEAEKEKQISDK